MNSVFNVSSIGAYPFVLGLFSGYPVGARIVSSLRQENKISKSDGEKLLVFTNNAGQNKILNPYIIYKIQDTRNLNHRNN